MIFLVYYGPSSGVSDSETGLEFGVVALERDHPS